MRYVLQCVMRDMKVLIVVLSFVSKYSALPTLRIYAFINISIGGPIADGCRWSV